MNKSIEILKNYWGFSNFRPLQEEIVEDAINGKDVLALLPTGGGKSICFQVPGLAREGITLVISPLIALMHDQVTNLKKRGIRAEAIVSGMSYKELDMILDNARFGGLKFLYTSPERIQSTLFIERFKRMNVGLIVVDEAHCISEWGHDFRPSFRLISKLRAIHPEVPLMALTATATNIVQDDICAQLELRNPAKHQASFVRSNIAYCAEESSNKLGTIFTYIDKYPNQTGIIYCQTRKSVKELGSALISKGIKAGVYHGGMNQQERKAMLTAWLEDKNRVMVATNAFGMGIDKPDVRYVLHFELPISLEAYFQEAGRAGRDGKESVTLALWNNKELEEQNNRLKQQFPEIDRIRLIYQSLCNFLKIAIGSGLSESYPLHISTWCKAFLLEAQEAYYALKLLEMNGNISFSEGFFQPTKIRFAIGSTSLYNFQLNHPNLLPLTTLIVRSYPGIFDEFKSIHEEEIIKRLDVSKAVFKEMLKQLEQYGVIDISWSTDSPTVTFLTERLPLDRLVISPVTYSERKKAAQDKLAAVHDFVSSKNCRSVQLIRYFGQESDPCGKCDSCIKNALIKDESQEWRKKIEHHLRQQKSLDELVVETGIPAELVKDFLKEMLAEKLLIYENGKYVRPN